MRLNQYVILPVLILISGCTRPAFINQPNILFIFTDDQRYNTIALTGDQQVITPHLDRLAQSGVTFTHTYNMGAWHGAVCVASRAMLNTGLTVWHARQAETDFTALLANRQFWSQRMQDLGYETYFAGKWHVKADPHELFDHVRHVRPGMPNQVPAGYHRPKGPDDSDWLPWDTVHGGFWKGGKHWSEVLADDAAVFFEQASKSSRPFFMYLAFNAPHDPRQSPKSFVDQYRVEEQILPEPFLTAYPYKDSIGCSASLRDEALAPFPRTEYAIRVNQLEYFALITHTDEQIGKILDLVDQYGMSDSTYIFMSADHGLSVGHHGLVGKQNMYDHSMRVPLIVSGPGIPGNSLRDQQVYLQDLVPTVLRLAGAENLPLIEFKSLLPLIEHHDATGHYEAVYGCYMDLQRMVRTPDYKMIYYPKVPVFRLYHVTEDPHETRDLAMHPDYADKLEELKRLLATQQKMMGDPLDLSQFLAN